MSQTRDGFVLDVIGNSELWYNVHSYPAFLVKE
jgi:hypothetical protein